MKTPLILALIVSICLLAACSEDPVANVNTIDAAANSTKVQDPAELAKDSWDELGLLINLPFEPTETLYRESADHKKLIAVIRFSNEDADKITAGKPGEDATVSPEAWFPPELISQSEMDITLQLLKGKRFPADTFFKEPYVSGTMVRVERTDYFVVELTAE